MILNFLFPGLGVVRTGDVRRGLLLATALIGLLLGSLVLFQIAPVATFRWSVLFLVLLVSASVTIMIASLILTWRHSAVPRLDRPWLSRWYGVLIIGIAANVASSMAVARIHRFYKPFYMPAESMAPTLLKNDRFLADMRFRGPLAIGDIILIRTPNGVYIKRVAAVAGDRIAMKNGIPILNGKPAIQRSRGTIHFIDGYNAIPARLIQEQLPGESGFHQILDIEPTELDDMTERTVPAGHVFLLGDNRDRSADSRVPAEFMGVEMAPLDHVVGRPLFIHWSRERSRIGMPALH